MCDDDVWFTTMLSWFEWVYYIFYALKRSTGVAIKIFEGDDFDKYYYVSFACEYFTITISRDDLQYSKDDIKEDYGFNGNVCMSIDYFSSRLEEDWKQVVKFLRLVTDERQEDFLWLHEDTIILKKQGEKFYTEATEAYQKETSTIRYPFELLGPYYEKLIVKED